MARRGAVTESLTRVTVVYCDDDDEFYIRVTSTLFTLTNSISKRIFGVGDLQDDAIN